MQENNLDKEVIGGIFIKIYFSSILGLLYDTY